LPAAGFSYQASEDARGWRKRLPRIGSIYVGFGIRSRLSLLARELVRTATSVTGNAPPIEIRDDSGTTVVDEYWGNHTLHQKPFISAGESERYLRKRNSEYPLFPEFMDLYGDHSGETVLDYGCGPGDDVTGFLLWSKAEKVIGMDVSAKALGFLSHRLALHRVDPGRVELIRITDATGKVPLSDASIDWVQCGGVLHHTTHPQQILAEFARVLKPGAEGRLMLYNRDSVMYHVWIAYAQLIVNNAFPGLDVDQAFTRSTDGPDCPVSDAWAPQRVLDMVAAAELEGTFRGGYLSIMELDWLKKYGEGAATDERLADEHREFVRELKLDERGYPTWRGKYAGIGGVYTIRKPGRTPADGPVN
jgi:SAM-dependent methyltransferase